MSIAEWIDRNDKRIRFVAWVAVGLWALIATIVANVPPDTYVKTTVAHFPPQYAAPMELSCDGREKAESWSVSSSNPNQSAIYTGWDQIPVLRDNVRVGYRLNVLNGAGSSNPRRPDVDVTLAVTCEHEHSRLVQMLLWPVYKLKSMAS
jgi:hypothetical protein